MDKFIFDMIYPGEDYYQACRTRHLGDDSLKIIRALFGDFNNRTLQFGALVCFGMLYTAADKGAMPLYDDEESATFLQRKLTKVGGKTALALNKSSIVACLSYIRKGNDETLQQNCRAALIEAVYHGKDYFEELRDAIVECNSEAGTGLFIPTWNELYEKWSQGYVHGLPAKVGVQETLLWE